VSGFGAASGRPSSRSARLWVSAALLIAATLPASLAWSEDESTTTTVPKSCRDAKPADLPLPTTLPAEDFESKLYAFVNARAYVTLGWCVDKALAGNLVRDTGPYIDNVYYGTHPAVRIYYSPEVMAWITGDREAPIADGAIIVKESFPPPAARYDGLGEEDVAAKLTSWTVMVRDKAGSKDGWFWSELSKDGPQAEHHKDAGLRYPESGFGQYCIRCHASAADHSTFSTTRNIEGFPGVPIRYRVDESWREDGAKEPSRPHAALEDQQDAQHSIADDAEAERGSPPPPAPNPVFLEIFAAPQLIEGGHVQPLPGEAEDRVVAAAEGKPGFLSSDQCMSCHGGLSHKSPTGPVQFLQAGPEFGEGYNLSYYGEWRWSPMGLAGRDPVFHAQLDSEIALLEKQFRSEPDKAATQIRHLENLCLSCHASMGQRQLSKDADRLGLDPLFRREYLFLGAKDRGHPYYKYGALGRDGVSCSLCHSARSPELAATDIDALKAYLARTTTGRLPTGEPDEIYGPFEDDEIVTQPMKNALGLTPKHDSFIKSSRLCGSCHTVILPNVDQPVAREDRTMLDKDPVEPLFQPFKHTIEQATYLEWFNSAYQDEYPQYNKTPERAQSCQGCHMPESFRSADGKHHMEPLKGRIAAIQDETYPEADHLVDADQLKVRFRESGISRHEFKGLNAMLLLMFEQFNETLGVRKTDVMTGADGVSQALEGFVKQARDKTIDLDVSTKLNGKDLTVDVAVTNKVGHRFPSGVGFRRSFLELLVSEQTAEGDRVVWGSGRTNSVGVLIDENGKVLPTEFFERDSDGAEQYQPHHEVITRQDQVQIYEELIRNAEGDFTTSFVRRHKHIKDNRLLPFGWQLRGPIPERYAELKDYLEATHPGPDAVRDADYVGGEGKDTVKYQLTLPEGVDPERVTVRATMYYQSVPPYWLRQRFETAPHMPATQRLFHIASRLQLDGTLLEDWKLELATATAAVSP
jgi:mono/diheme cytochrome c family protein